MKITVFTSNLARHLSLINTLSKICDEVFAVIETTTIFPGEKEGVFSKSLVMEKYFKNVIESELKIFGEISLLPENVRPFVIKMGDLSLLSMNQLKPVLNSDKYIVFGSSYIKGNLIDALIKNGAYNIHMGVSPYYRGSSCNFWAAYDNNFHFVGATIHLLSKGLDSGDILFHTFPTYAENVFDLGMMAVKSAHVGIANYIKNEKKYQLLAIQQNKEKEIRYTTRKDFTDKIAQKFLKNLPTKDVILECCKKRKESNFKTPIVLLD